MMGSVVYRMCEQERPVMAQSMFPLKNAQWVSSAKMSRCVGEDGVTRARHVVRLDGLVEGRVGCGELLQRGQLIPQRREEADGVVGDVEPDERSRLEEVERELRDVVLRDVEFREFVEVRDGVGEDGGVARDERE